MHLRFDSTQYVFFFCVTRVVQFSSNIDFGESFPFALLISAFHGPLIAAFVVVMSGRNDTR